MKAVKAWMKREVTTGEPIFENGEYVLLPTSGHGGDYEYFTSVLIIPAADVEAMRKNIIDIYCKDCEVEPYSCPEMADKVNAIRTCPAYKFLKATGQEVKE